MPMKRRLAIITGSARRVGRAVALHLASSGFDIVFTYHNSREDAQTLCRELEDCGAVALAVQADLTNIPGDIPAIVEQFASLDRPLDVLINNASIYLPDSATDPDLAGRLWRIHVTAPLLLAQSLAPSLADAGGCIINLCDILAERPMPGYLAYCASKAGLVNLTRGLARELAPAIRVNGISPGVAQWPAHYTDQQKEQLIRRIPLARAGTPQDIADTVLFLIHSGYITGQIIAVDGGRSIA